jgi:spore coat-associated protein N
MGIKKQLAGAVLAAGVGIAAISGGTFALFTANASNSGNTFTAGTITIADATGGAAFATSQHIGNLAPGDSDSKTLTINNTGSLHAWVKIDSATKTGDLFGGANPVSVTYDTAPVLIPAGGSYTFNVGYSFPLAAGNEYQGDTGSVTFNVVAVQSKNNGDVNNNGVVDTGDAPVSWN